MNLEVASTSRADKGKSNSSLISPHMNGPQTVEGVWWTDGDKDSAPVFGILDFDPESGVTLSVKLTEQYATLEEVAQAAEELLKNISTTVFGKDKDNRPITLFGCSPKKSTASPGLQTLAISVQVAALGVIAPNWEELQFDHINAEFSLLHNWLGTSIVSVQGRKRNRSRAAGPLQSRREASSRIHRRMKRSATVESLSHDCLLAIKVHKRQVTKVDVAQQDEVQFWPNLQFDHNRSETTIQQGHGVVFRHSEDLPAKIALHEKAESFRRFLTLLTGRVVFIDRVYFLPWVNGQQIEVELLRPNPGVRSAERTLPGEAMHASFKDIRNRASEVISQWYRLESSLSDVLNLYFATVFNQSLYLHQNFLFLAQALEVYHRTSPNFENQVQPKAEFKARKKKITDAIPAEKDWINEKLAHANEKTLAQRLGELIALHPNDAEQFIENRDHFCDSIRHTRNHFTHYGTSEEGKEKIVEGVELMKLTFQMQTLLEICIFSDLGITGEPIRRIIEKFKGYKFFEL